MRVWFPEKKITIPEMVALYKPATNCILVWDARQFDGKELVQAAHQFTGQTFGQPTHYQEILKYHRTNTMRVEVLFPIDFR